MISRRWWVRWAGGVSVLGALGGCDDSRPCFLYACSTAATLTWKLTSEATNGEFEVRLCHGDRCEDKVVAASSDPARSCDGDLEPGATVACVQSVEGGLEFSASWTFNEGQPREKTFSLRIVERERGAVLLDQSRALTFTKDPAPDDCHDCWSALAELDAS
jgi:hypothetical protein